MYRYARLGCAGVEMKPILWTINGVNGWYIWSIKHKDILEGGCCGPFFTESDAWQAISKIELAQKGAEDE